MLKHDVFRKEARIREEMDFMQQQQPSQNKRKERKEKKDEVPATLEVFFL